MKTIGVIPARFASTRFPGKVLELIDGHPMIEHVWNKAVQCGELNEILIACDHPRVFQTVQKFGARAVMTDMHHSCGTDRIAQAVASLDVEIVVNIQADEPFIDSNTIDRLALLLKQDTECSMGTVIREMTDDLDFKNPNVVKCVIDNKGYALYFSRSQIPYHRNLDTTFQLKCYKHLGIYAYRKEFLMQYNNLPKGVLEIAEQLEQLRALEQGYKIKTILTEFESIAVDTPDDLMKAQVWYAKLNSTKK